MAQWRTRTGMIPLALPANPPKKGGYTHAVVAHMPPFTLYIPFAKAVLTTHRGRRVVCRPALPVEDGSSSQSGACLFQDQCTIEDRERRVVGMQASNVAQIVRL